MIIASGIHDKGSESRRIAQTLNAIALQFLAITKGDSQIFVERRSTSWEGGMTWFGRGIRGAVGLGIIGLLVAGGTGLVRAQVLTLNPSNLPGAKVPTSPSQGSINFLCYDGATGAFLNCGVLVELRPLDPTFGGHESHNLAGQLLGKLGDATGCCDKSAHGNTLDAFYTVQYIAPEASGEVQLYVTWTPPPNWECFDNIEGTLGDTPRSPCTGIGHFDVGYPLQPLAPLDDPTYKVVRGDEVRHPNGTSGTAKTLQALKQVANIYTNYLVVASLPGARLSINDISLPKGGLFDWQPQNEWAVPHQTHRRGTEVDINQTPVGALVPVPCPDDYELQAAIDVVQASLGASLPALTCENGKGKPDPAGPQKHIGF